MVPGFVYPIVDVVFDGRRLQFDVAKNELWRNWCAIQTPIADGGSYNCAHNWSYSSNDGITCTQVNPATQEQTSVDCRKLELCGGPPCDCNADGCGIQSYDRAHFDMVIDGSHADGSYGFGGMPDFHLTKDGAPPMDPDPSPAIDLTALAADIWQGHVENFQYFDESDQVRFELLGTDPLEGRITFGALPPPPTPTDPDVGYPPDPYYAPEHISGLVPGFAYSLVDPVLEGNQLKFDISNAEPWNAWCGLQTPIADAANGVGYMCVNNWGSSNEGGVCTQTNPANPEEKQIVDCRKLELCSAGQPCVCTATGCEGKAFEDYHFDLTLQPAHIDGSYGPGPGNEIHLTQR